MGRVKVLSEVLAHKIAAGEIVERPASVVKELVENSLDAESTTIQIEVQDGGQRLIRVRDDGIGMSPEDALLAFQHHATSKIQTMADLDQISTLGFRGEALPSIASVSRLTVRTIDCEIVESSLPVGTEILFQGGKIIHQKEIAWPSGSEVTVEDLFFNVPARRKFLKRTATELNHVVRQVSHYALARPDVGFRLQHDRPILDAPAVSSLKERVYQVLGEAFLANLVPVEYKRDGVRVHGFTSLPHEQRNNSSTQYFFVNGRSIRDRVITHAVRLAYRDLIPSTAHAVALLFIELDHRLVDVNVHPSKIEVRFQDSSRVHRAIYHGIEEALLKNQAGLSSLARDVPLDQLRTRNLPGHEAGVARSIEHYFQRQPDSSFGFPQFRGAFSGSAPAATPPGSQQPAGQTEQTDPHGNLIPDTGGLSPIPVVLGQFVESFVVAADREGVMLVDQHVAHERILYDRALRKMKSGERAPTQRLLIPQTVELSVEQKTRADILMEQLNANGFEVEWFGERTLVVRGLPELGAACEEVSQLLQDLLDGAREADSGSQRVREKIAISLSCRAAIKINTPLTTDKMRWLVDELFRCDNPYTCPHGRPIILRMEIEDILRGFKRI